MDCIGPEHWKLSKYVIWLQNHNFCFTTIGPTPAPPQIITILLGRTWLQKVTKTVSYNHSEELEGKIPNNCFTLQNLKTNNNCLKVSDYRLNHNNCSSVFNLNSKLLTTFSLYGTRVLKPINSFVVCDLLSKIKLILFHFVDFECKTH